MRCYAASFTFGILYWSSVLCCLYFECKLFFCFFFFALDILSSKTSIIRRYTEGKLRRGQVLMNCLSYDADHKAVNLELVT